MTISIEKIKEIFDRRNKGESWTQISDAVDLPKTTVRTVYKSKLPMLELLKIKEHCLWGSECKELCTPECKSYNNALCDIKASKNLQKLFAERKNQGE